MLHTKFRENQPAGSGENFEGFLPYMDMAGHLGHVTRMPSTNFRSPYPRRLHINFGFNWPSGFRGEDVCNCERRTTTDDAGRTPDHGYTKSR